MKTIKFEATIEPPISPNGPEAQYRLIGILAKDIFGDKTPSLHINVSETKNVPSTESYRAPRAFIVSAHYDPACELSVNDWKKNMLDFAEKMRTYNDWAKSTLIPVNIMFIGGGEVDVYNLANKNDVKEAKDEIDKDDIISADDLLK